MESRMWPCPDCGDVRRFVQPVCHDQHGGDGGECPEWACVDCGAAFVTGEIAAVVDAGPMRHAA